MVAEVITGHGDCRALDTHELSVADYTSKSFVGEFLANRLVHCVLGLEFLGKCRDMISPPARDYEIQRINANCVAHVDYRPPR